MDRLMTFFDEAMAEPKADPLLLIATLVLDFECIHPFADGNGASGG